MTPPLREPSGANGPMRVVLTALADPGPVAEIVREALDLHLAACASAFPVTSRFWWGGRVEESREVLVLFKTTPKKVGALFRFLERRHPYEVPEIVELDVARAHSPYVRYLVQTLEGSSPPTPRGGPAARQPRHPGSRRARRAHHPGRTRGRRHRPY